LILPKNTIRRHHAWNGRYGMPSRLPGAEEMLNQFLHYSVIRSIFPKPNQLIQSSLPWWLTGCGWSIRQAERNGLTFVNIVKNCMAGYPAIQFFTQKIYDTVT